MKEVAASRKRKMNSVEKDWQACDLSKHEAKVKHTTTKWKLWTVAQLARWAVEKHQLKIDMEEMKRWRLQREKPRRDTEEMLRGRAKIEGANELQMDIEIAKIAEYGRKGCIGRNELTFMLPIGQKRRRRRGKGKDQARR